MKHFFPKFRLRPKKIKIFTKNGTLFFPRIKVDTFAQMYTRVKLLGGDADVDHTQTIGGDTVKLLRGIYSPCVSALLLTKCSPVSSKALNFR